MILVQNRQLLLNGNNNLDYYFKLLNVIILNVRYKTVSDFWNKI